MTNALNKNSKVIPWDLEAISETSQSRVEWHLSNKGLVRFLKGPGVRFVLPKISFIYDFYWQAFYEHKIFEALHQEFEFPLGPFNIYVNK